MTTRNAVYLLPFALFTLVLFALPLASSVTDGEPEQVADEGQSDEGMSQYNKRCAMCHGKDGVAKKMAEGSANLNDPEWQKSTSIEEINNVTAEGKGKMKGFKGKLTPEQIEAISHYIMTLK